LGPNGHHLAQTPSFRSSFGTTDHFLAQLGRFEPIKNSNHRVFKDLRFRPGRIKGERATRPFLCALCVSVAGFRFFSEAPIADKATGDPAENLDYQDARPLTAPTFPLFLTD
jgi:hypothetical protein